MRKIIQLLKYMLALFVASLMLVIFSTAYLKWTLGNPTSLLDKVVLVTGGQAHTGWKFASILCFIWFWPFGNMYLSRNKQLIYDILNNLKALSENLDRIMASGPFKDRLLDFKSGSISQIIRCIQRLSARSPALFSRCIDGEITVIELPDAHCITELSERVIQIRVNAIQYFGKAGIGASISLLLLYKYLSDTPISIFSIQSLMLIVGGYLCGRVAGDFIGNHTHNIFNLAGMAQLLEDDPPRAKKAIYRPAIQPLEMEVAVIHSNRGTLLRTRFGQTSCLSDLEEAVSEYRKAVSLTLPGEPESPGRLNNLSNGLRDLYEQTSRMEYLEESIEVSRKAVRLAPPDYPHLPVCLNNLGMSLRIRSEQNNRLEDLEKAICTCRKALEEAQRQAPPDSPELPLILKNLSVSLLNRYLLFDQPDDLDEAIRSSQEAVRLTPANSPDRACVLHNQGIALLKRYQRNRSKAEDVSMEDLDISIEALQQALNLEPPQSPYHAASLDGLASGFISHYLSTRCQEDLEKALHFSQEAVNCSSPKSTSYQVFLKNFNRRENSRYIDDIEPFLQTDTWAEACQVIAKNPKLLSDGVDARLRLLQDMAEKHGDLTAYGQLKEHRSMLRLCRKIGVKQVCAEKANTISIPPEFLDDFRKAMRSAMRYEHAYDQAALDDAAAAWESILEHPAFTSSPVTFQGIVLNDAGSTFSQRYSIQGCLDDLKRAISLRQSARELTPLDALERPVILGNLGISLGQAGRCDEAIQVYRDALNLAIDSTVIGGVQIRAHILQCLGADLIRRYGQTGQSEDLKEAIRTCQEAVDLTTPQSPFYLSYLNTLAEGLYHRYQRDKLRKDLDEVVRIDDLVLTSMDHTFGFLPVADQVGRQEAWVDQYARSVESHLEAGQINQALVIAEGSKSRLLNNFLGRSEHLTPSTIPSALTYLTQREEYLIKELNAQDKKALSSYDLRNQSEETTRLRTLEERQNLLTQLRAHWKHMEKYAPDYVALRRGDRPDWKDLVRLAADLGTETALVSLFTTGRRTLLFILQAGKDAPTLLEFPLGNADWEDLMRRFDKEVRNFDSSRQLGETWYQQSLLPLLKNATPHLEGVQKVVVAPHADGHSLPWGVLAERAGWKVPVITIPALGLLGRLRQRPVREKSEVLVVGNPTGDLKFAEDEAKRVANLLRTEPLLRGNATKEAVLAKLADARLAHFACHATFNRDSPFKSGIKLANGILEAREVMKQEVMKQELRMPDFLSLSACETGMAKRLGGDELAGLSQVFLQAGAKSLLVSLWRVEDSATTDLMTDFYKAWRNDGKDQATALYNAMVATRKTRPEWDHSYYWGAFTLVGDWRIKLPNNLEE